MLSALLQKIVEANDMLHTEQYDESIQAANRDASPGQNRFKANVLAFHGRNIPAISLHAYLTRILKYCPVTNDVFLSLLVYFDRIAKRANNGDFSTFGQPPLQPQETPTSLHPQVFVIDSYNIHRLIISGITVASKFFSDVFYKNSRYAKVGGLPLEELNHLEIQFLLLLDFKLMIQVEEMNRYGDLLLKFWKREQLKQPN
ncbi:DEKNAAC105126 [Brettanomyces naardenensis]|uniref:Cyclin n=1 Tax=Brettanomyces naardenensis TaxID=13370 RepID=A0A448YT49_BRENA|nr:DEKNAAC105126 [Brettanomyces naardenensis]